MGPKLATVARRGLHLHPVALTCSPPLARLRQVLSEMPHDDSNPAEPTAAELKAVFLAAWGA